MESALPVRNPGQPVGSGNGGPYLAGGCLSHALQRGLRHWLDNDDHLCPNHNSSAIRPGGHLTRNSLSQHYRQLRSHVVEWDSEQHRWDLSDDHDYNVERETSNPDSADAHHRERSRRYAAPWSVLRAGWDRFGTHGSPDRACEIPDGRLGKRIRHWPI